MAILVGSTAFSLFVGKVVKPLWSASRRADEMVPMLAELTEQLRPVPDVFTILKEIVGQVRSDSGSSLLDIIKRLDAASERNAVSNTALLSLLSALGTRIDEGAATALRNEVNAAAVAVRLANSQSRADAEIGLPGEAADAASRSDPEA